LLHLEANGQRPFIIFHRASPPRARHRATVSQVFIILPSVVIRRHPFNAA
jgi:hypothetical protein